MQDYRIVNGVRFPFRIDETIGDFHGVTVVGLEVNPDGIGAGFTKEEDRCCCCVPSCRSRY